VMLTCMQMQSLGHAILTSVKGSTGGVSQAIAIHTKGRVEYVNLRGRSTEGFQMG